jgi:hypothetical protein
VAQSGVSSVAIDDQGRARIGATLARGEYAEVIFFGAQDEWIVAGTLTVCRSGGDTALEAGDLP